MKKKVISAIILVVLILAFLLSYIISYANSDETIYVNLTKANPNNQIGYGINDPTTANIEGQSAANAYIWNLATYDYDEINKTYSLSDAQRDLYCVKANYGDTWNTNYSTQVAYNLSYDLESDRADLLDAIVDDADIDGDDVVKTLLTESGYYRELLWILDNAYISGKTDKIEFLSNIGFKYDDEYDVYYYEPIEGYDYSTLISSSGSVDGYLEEYFITDEDIKAVQRAAIWYYTNYKIDNEAVFNQAGDADWLNISVDNGSTYKQLASITSATTPEGITRNDQANVLYNYLIDAAEDNVDDYVADEQGNYAIKNAASVNTTGLTEISEGKYRLQATRVGSNYVIGPIVINKNSNASYDISIAVTNQDGTVSYTYTDVNGTSLGVSDIKSLVGRTEGFYISVSREDVEKINVKIEVSQERTQKTLWLVGNEEIDATGKITEVELTKAEQPVVEIERTSEPVTIEFESEPNEFDLALRKHITAVNGTDVTTREPNIDLSTLQTGTTATYKHRKDPVIVQDKDEVTYILTIYNEGNKAGYASQIIDQLPTGLVSSATGTVWSKGKNGQNKNEYTLNYKASDNQIILTITDQASAQSLQPYTTGNLDYETIEIKCKVAQEPDTKEQIILTNVAWISEAYDSEEGKVISSEGTLDRDSQPQTSPNVDADMDKTINHIGNESNKSDLTDSTYHYAGEQDDDDFEKLVLMPVEKIFDLELVKFIAAISKDAKIDEGEYLTDTKKSNGIYERAPKISIVKEQDSEDRRLHCDWSPSNKIPVLVEEGDYVLYTIRVYNAGEVDGYAAEIKDHLPTGLEFVETTDETAEYFGIWNIDEVEQNGNVKQVLSTDYLAKGRGKETNAEQGEENYTANLLKALDPDGEVTDGENRNPDYRDVQVLCRVTESAQSKSVLVNYAQISEDTDKDGNDIDDDDSIPNNLPEDGPHEDDEDFESIKLQCFDLSLRKFITAVNNKDLNGAREPVVDVTPLKNGTDTTTAIYIHPKTPVSVQVGDKVIYTIRVYNEGDFDGYASEIKDYLPVYLQYVEDSEINEQYEWEISDDGRIATTKYLANEKLTGFAGTELDYADVKIECLVVNNAPVKQNQTNIAEISEYKYGETVVPEDIDSESNSEEENLPEDNELPSYKDEELDKEYVPGNEDDDDFEKVYVKEFDFALRKFITKVQEKEVTTRVPQVDTTPLKNGENTATYTHPKDALIVHVGDIVIYTLRIYNEGEIDGYASEITDDIPEYLEYLPEDSTNVEYMWKMYNENGEETENIEDAVKVKTNYLSKENGEDNLIKAFDGTTLDYKDIKIAFKVKDPNSNEYIITNHAQISNDTDENGNDVKDKDSEPDKWNEGEDDQDVENVKVQYFDLSLLKFVSKVIIIEDGKETISETGYNGYEDPEPVVKVELHKKKLSDVVVKFGYGITITNEGDIAGYATEITDYIPEGLRFDATDNPEWMDEGNNVISTRQLEGTLLQPGESATVEVILTWINGADNLALKTNTAEISEDDNEYGVPDKDSTPDNKQEGEDDIDIAKVILTIATGAAKTYFTLTLGLLAVVLVGIALIKKFVI